MDDNYLQLYKAWQNFIKFGKEDRNDLRPILLKSWKRSAGYGIDPYLHETKPTIDVELLRKKNEQLISVTRPFMEVIFNLVKGSGFVVILIDKKGYVLELIGDEDVIQTAKRNYLLPGANRCEETVGTNAIGLALAEKKPVQIFGPEHFNFHFHTWTCSAAPIRDPAGEIIGILNMSGHYSLIHKHTLGMIVSMVRAIERELSLQKTHLEALLANEYLKAVTNSVHDGLLALDKNRNVIHANSIAAHILGKDKGSIINKNIKEVLDPTLGFDKILNGCFVDREFYFKKGNVKSYCLVTTMPIKNKADVLGIVVLLREKKKVHHLVHRIVGATASFVFEDIIGESQPLKECIELAKTFADTDSRVLIEGESGTGKELFAQAIHNHSKRKEGPFLAVNCSAIPRDLIESELFGYEEGAFTGAKKRGKPGKFELAEGGTLFLDEISSMPLNMQAKLLRVLQENRLVRVGGINIIPLNVRIIAATNRDLNDLIKEGSFREDFYYRLSVVTIKIPPLRERKDDIPVLIEYLGAKIGARVGINSINFTQEVLNTFMSYDWPGNIRELENVMERAIILAKGAEVGINLLPEKIRNIKNNIDALNKKSSFFQKGISLEDLEIKAIREALNKTKGNISKAARLLGVSRNTIYNKLKKIEGNTSA